jgi:hypothetical protein
VKRPAPEHPQASEISRTIVNIEPGPRMPRPSIPPPESYPAFL